MAESENKEPRILRANKRGAEVKPPPEPVSATRGFWEIQTELARLQNAPDQAKEDDLKLERARLIREAKDIGVFDTLKGLFVDIQQNNSLVDSIAKIRALPLHQYEIEAQGIKGWKPEFEGMIRHYRDGALRNMALARLEANGNGSTPLAQRTRELNRLLGWGAPPQLDQLANPNPAPATSPDIADSLQDLVAIGTEQRNLTEQQLEALRRGFGVLVGLTETKSALNPDTWEQQPPLWYENLSREEKEAVKNVLVFNYIAGVMVKTGEATYQPWAALGDAEKGYVPLIHAEAIQYQLEHFPGFRIALATMTDSIFESRNDTGALYISDNGYDLMHDSTVFRQYKKDLIDALVNHYSSDPSAQNWAAAKNITVKDMATLMVSMADNFLMGTASYLAGDMRRSYDPQTNDGHRQDIEDPGVNGGDDIRAFLNPGLKLPKKLIVEGAGYDTKEEFWLGTFGAWLRFNAINNIDGFRDDFIAGRINYIPRKLFPGLLEFTMLDSGGDKKTAAQILTNSTLIIAGAGRGSVSQLLDYAGGANAIDFTSGNSELFGAYNGKRVQAIKVYENLGSSGGPRTNAMTVEGFYNALARVRKMDCINNIPELMDAWYNPDFIAANLAQIVSQGEGPIVGIREIVLNIDPKLSYDTAVNRTLSGNSNIFGRDEPGRPPLNLTRRGLLKTFNAQDTARISIGSIAHALGLNESLLSKRTRLINKARRNREEVARDY